MTGRILRRSRAREKPEFAVGFGLLLWASRKTQPNHSGRISRTHRPARELERRRSARASLVHLAHHTADTEPLEHDRVARHLDHLRVVDLRSDQLASSIGFTVLSISVAN